MVFVFCFFLCLGLVWFGSLFFFFFLLCFVLFFFLIVYSRGFLKQVRVIGCVKRVGLRKGGGGGGGLNVGVRKRDEVWAWVYGCTCRNRRSNLCQHVSVSSVLRSQITLTNRVHGDTNRQLRIQKSWFRFIPRVLPSNNLEI